MKINVDNKNGRVIANGYYKGKKIRAIAHCKEENFDEKFGTELAALKFKVKQKIAQKSVHEKYVKKLHSMILWCFSQINQESQIISDLDKKIMQRKSECDQFVKSVFH